MTEADRISQWASVPHELAELVVMGADNAGLSIRSLRGERRLRCLVQVRDSIISQARERGFNFSEIGRALNRDHSTIMHSANKGLEARG